MFGNHLESADASQYVAAKSRNLPDMFIKRVQKSASKTAYLTKVNGAWTPTTWQKFYDQSASFAGYLLAKGLGLEDKICIMGSTRPEWAICDMGGQLAGVVTVGAYPTMSSSQLAYIINHSDAKICVVEGKAEIEKLLGIRSETPNLSHVVVWNPEGVAKDLLDEGWVVPLAEAFKGKTDAAAIQARVDSIKPGNTAIIVYTSGTTGPPKGAMISHNNILQVLIGCEPLLPIGEGDISLNFLPMAHVAERIASFYGRISMGVTAAYASSIPAVLAEVKEIRPTIFGSVPRIFEKAYSKIFSEVAKASPGKQKAFRWAERVGREAVRHWQADKPLPLGLQLQYKLADKLVFSKIREVFGGRVKHFATGAAPIAYEVLEFFWAAGFPIYEVYGMTEATVLTHGNPLRAVRIGTVGKPISVVEERLAEDGEILIKGPTVFLGYYKNPEATAEAIDADGWLHTGDIGKKDAKGYLRIVDRKKHIIITSGGKNITPANIEQEIKTQDPLISQVHAHGDRRAYLTAMITIHPIEAIDYAKANGLVKDPAEADKMAAELMSNPLARPAGLQDLMQAVTENAEVKRRMIEAVKKGNQNLARVETIKKVYVLDRDFSVEEDEITPTLKVKRKEVEKKFEPIFDRLYAEKDFGLAIGGPSEEGA
jgi:long-chain acyl-CoA synthetase